MAKKTTTKKNSKVSVSYRGASIFEVANYVHHETVRHCEYCGKPMNRSDVNDFGSLCESYTLIVKEGIKQRLRVERTKTSLKL